ncbi:amyloid-beta A4 protein [Pteropus alecto]|uniref:Pancreatic trypsin inhibitor n=1 Tax=Pteropus alecto TaxID=9402 RepID=L5JYS9_PTEAL|nr:amyloid-beta A4 protein [Pteropus alecto]ELK04237.1 Pancreatic trypsin inhibitor [Pteropus alecto]
MDALCLSAAPLVLLSILVAGAQGSDTSRPVFCLEPPYQGPGEATIHRFFFNTSSGLCEDFMFGGGRAKLNNFLTKEECTRVCSGHRPALQAQYKLELEAQPEPEDEIKDILEDKIEDRDTDENSKDDDEVEDEPEIEIEYAINDESMDEDFEDNGEDEDNDPYEDELQIKIEYEVES